MLSFGLGIGALLVIAGMITYLLAPRVGPNPIFGVRVGYAYANREVWDKTNRFGGILLAFVGLAIVLLALLLQLLNMAPGTAMPILTAVMLITMLGSVVWMFVYARGLAQGTALAHEMRPVGFRWAYVAPVLATFALLLALAVYVCPTLPANHVATHFNLNDQPDSWSARNVFMVSFLAIAACFVLLDLVVVWLATREPLVAFGRWGRGWRLDPEQGLVYAGIAFGVMNLILMAALWDVAWFNTHGVHAFPLTLFLWMVVLLILFFSGLFFMLGRRVSPRREVGG